MRRKPLVVSLLVALAVGGVCVAVIRRPAPLPRDSSAPGGFQVDPDHPCGVVCAAVVGHALGKPLTLRQAREAVGVDGLARTSMADLVDGLHRLGFATTGVKLTRRLLDYSPAPVILHVDNAHFLVVLPVGDGSVVVIDPPNEVHTEAISSLAARWDGEAVLVQKTPAELRKALASVGLGQAAVQGVE
ncbi:MAG TPA: cysteine peptidase family C39 domain-containing protein [Gemmataceae bacterium]|nr:cysteine peptidase family C39 domain-containing protein [Gemmataceae bacterium]